MKRITVLILAIILCAGKSFAAPAATNSIPTWAKYTSDSIDRTDYIATTNRSVTTESDSGTSYAATVQQIEIATTTAGEAEWYGAIAGDATDDSAAINSAMAAYGHVILGPGNYLISAQLTMQAGQWLQGSGLHQTTLTKHFNGDMFGNFPGSSGITDLAIDGEGATYTGRILPITGTNGQQYMRDFSIVDCNGYCIEFDGITSGSQSTFVNGTIARYNGLTGGRYSVKIDDDERTEATPAKFFGIESNGTLFIDFGGANNIYAIGCWSGGYRYTADTRAAEVIGGRIGNILNMDIDGHGNVISGCDVGPNLALVSGSDNNTLQGNSYNGVITDNSGNGRSQIDYPSVSYNPAWTASSSNPAIGNGYLIGEQSRSGDKITVSVELSIGSTTTFGSGTWRFSLPKAPSPTTGLTQMLPVLLSDNGTTQTIGMAQIVSGVAYVEILIPGTLSYVNATTPWTWATGDMIRMTFTYIL